MDGVSHESIAAGTSSETVIPNKNSYFMYIQLLTVNYSTLYRFQHRVKELIEWKLQTEVVDISHDSYVNLSDL